MSLRRLLVQRIVVGIVTAWAVLTGVFLVFSASKRWRLDHLISIAEFGGATEEEISQLRETYLGLRNLDRPLYEQYVDWMGNMLTLQWGSSFQSGEKVRPMIVDATITTGRYVVPAIVLSLCVALLVGVYVALNDGSNRDRGVRGLTYFGLGIPNFYLGAFVLAASSGVVYTAEFRGGQAAARDLPFLYDTVVPILLLTTTLVAAITSYTRAYAVDLVTDDMVKAVRAKGGGRFDIARHIVRNAAVSLVSIAFTETLSLLAISVFVIEALFGIDGLGLTLYNAIWTQDLPVVLGATLVIVSAGVAGNVLQDVAYSRLDPRVDTGAR